ncbi:hypothetical protein AK812_SmicGene13164 [Symbiodinium microadriaticum]|uniref:Uncharacterized protein n=1 Tax=Symbiodinium microadriaticum TaxID=2951 RepID=A0A1Q9E8V9_SYMMI|nr:hypothetical protein AK812_SmicGene13164 [Symbiodinium microadriaticum]
MTVNRSKLSYLDAQQDTGRYVQEPVLWCIAFGDNGPTAIPLSATCLAMMMYWALLMDFTLLSMRISAFVLVCGNVLADVGLFSLALLFLILAFATSISSLNHRLAEFDGVPELRVLVAVARQMTLGMFPPAKYGDFRSEIAVLVAVSVFVATADDDWVLVGQGTGEDNFIVRLTEEAGSARQNGSLIDSARSQTRALWPERGATKIGNGVSGTASAADTLIEVAQLNQSYRDIFEDMQGFARLNRASVTSDIIDQMSRKKWSKFLSFEDPLEFNEGALPLAGLPPCTKVGMAGGIQVLEPANANMVTEDIIKRYGGPTAPSTPWPQVSPIDDPDCMEPDEQSEESKFARLEKLIIRATKKTKDKASKGKKTPSALDASDLGSDQESAETLNQGQTGKCRLGDFYSYMGSSTTPDCFQQNKWPRPQLTVKIPIIIATSNIVLAVIIEMVLSVFNMSMEQWATFKAMFPSDSCGDAGNDGDGADDDSRDFSQHYEADFFILVPIVATLLLMTVWGPSSFDQVCPEKLFRRRRYRIPLVEQKRAMSAVPSTTLTRARRSFAERQATAACWHYTSCDSPDRAYQVSGQSQLVGSRALLHRLKKSVSFAAEVSEAVSVASSDSGDGGTLEVASVAARPRERPWFPWCALSCD